MNKKGYYSSGQFAKMAHVSVRTIRFYDQKGLLAPSYITKSGARFYTDYDFAILQQILLLKYLGFSLDEIKEIPNGQADNHFILNALKMQKKLLSERIDEMKNVEEGVNATIKALEKSATPDWKQMLDLIHMTSMENNLKSQYQNASNISARIDLHNKYSTNKQRWFNWVLQECDISSGMDILELGCGNGALWAENISELSKRNYTDIQITLSDISAGILHDARQNIESATKAYSKELRDLTFSYKAFDLNSIPFEDNSFDLVIAGHVLFYCEDVHLACKEISRVLKPGGRLVCSTYSSNHMKEIRELVKEFDDRIMLSSNDLYKIFGLENGADILRDVFEEVELKKYKDEIIITDSGPLIDYIFSCHGNQNHYLLNRYAEFKNYIMKKVSHEFHITKDAGLFIATKQKAK